MVVPKLKGWFLIAVVMAAVLGLLFAARPAPASSGAPPRIQHGLASYYGPGFHGEETASGRIFNQNELVAAHRTLPLGSVIRVTNLENGRRVVVKVIDRGPYGRNYRRGTIVDVSVAAAKRLDFIRDGLVRVRLEVLELGNRSAS